jgi:hypothetical protein
VQASRTQGLCTEHFMPGVEKEEACQARKGRFLPECSAWLVGRSGESYLLNCEIRAQYGTCREHVPAAEQARDHVMLARLFDGMMVNPRALRPGKGLPAFEKEMRQQAAHYPPKSFQSCQALGGAWYATCARKAGGASPGSPGLASHDGRGRAACRAGISISGLKRRRMT